MRCCTRKQREIDVKRSLSHRKCALGGKKSITLNAKKSGRKNSNRSKSREELNLYFDESLVDLRKENNGNLIIFLPSQMNFSIDFERTSATLTAIRYYAEMTLRGSRHKLTSVNFEKLEKISTSSALVLTAELSKWEDSIGRKLKSNVYSWNETVRKQLIELGFFNLFKKPSANLLDFKVNNTHLRFVEYIKGKRGEKSKTRILKDSLHKIINNEVVDRWTFLDSGLGEAITNVTHHAYPEASRFNESDKNWYLTGSFNSTNNTLKIAFYDQGIGIPDSLPTSKIYEKVLEFARNVGNIEEKLHKTLLKAAVSVSRTRTDEVGRGEGLRDLLTFIQQRKNGYLSILSLKGLYKYTMSNGIESEKTESFDNPIHGTLIIWSVKLN